LAGLVGKEHRDVPWSEACFQLLILPVPDISRVASEGLRSVGEKRHLFPLSTQPFILRDLPFVPQNGNWHFKKAKSISKIADALPASVENYSSTQINVTQGEK
jgi:hypothetical protein